jgi:hypothetical protein
MRKTYIELACAQSQAVESVSIIFARRHNNPSTFIPKSEKKALWRGALLSSYFIFRARTKTSLPQRITVKRQLSSDKLAAALSHLWHTRGLPVQLVALTQVRPVKFLQPSLIGTQCNAQDRLHSGQRAQVRRLTDQDNIRHKTFDSRQPRDTMI